MSLTLNSIEQKSTPEPDAKYRKALKEINKLISFNNSLKKQFAFTQDQHSNLVVIYNELQKAYAQLELKQKKYLERVQTLERIISNDDELLSIYKIECNLENAHLSYKNSASSRKSKELENTGSLSQYMDTKKKLDQVQERLRLKEKENYFLGEELKKKSQENIQLMERLEALSAQENPYLQQIEEKNRELFSRLEEVEQQLMKQKNYNSSLVKEIEENKKQFIMKSVDFKSKAPSNSIPQKNIKDQVSFSAEYLYPTQIQRNVYTRKIGQLETLVSKLKKQHEASKTKYKKEIKKWRDESEHQKKCNIQMNSFIVKQQMFIEQIYGRKQIQIDNSVGSLSPIHAYDSRPRYSHYQPQSYSNQLERRQKEEIIKNRQLMNRKKFSEKERDIFNSKKWFQYI